MAGPPKATYQTFQTSWSKTLSWADSKGIPRTAWYPVYQLDAQRMMTGNYPMAMGQRVRMILASYNPENITPLPTDQPASGASGLFHNAVHDLQNIFTGLNPIHLGPALYDMVDNTLKHPSKILDPTADTLGQLIPGMSVIGQVEKQGLGSLSKDPVSSLLDVLPIFDGATTIVGKAGKLGDAAAHLAGFPSGDVMADQGAVRTALHAVGNFPMPGPRIPATYRGIPLRDATGNLQLVRQTINSRFSRYAKTIGLSRIQADTAEYISTLSAESSIKAQKLTENLAAAAKKATPQEFTEARTLLETSQKHPDYASFANDPSISDGAKRIIAAFEDAAAFLQEKGLAAGDIVKILMPDGSIEIYASTGIGRIVKNARDALTAAQVDLEHKSAGLDSLEQEIAHNDATNALDWSRFDVLVNRIRTARARDTASADRQLLGHPVVPKGEPQLANELRGAPPGRTPLPYDLITDEATRQIEDIFSDGGLIAQAKVAYEAKDFRTFRDLLKEINRKLKNKSLARYHSPLLDEVRRLGRQFYDYSRTRVKKADKFASLYSASHLGFEKATETLAKANATFEKVVWENPSAVWSTLFTKSFLENLLKHEDGIRVMEEGLKWMDAQGLPHESIKSFRENPTVFMDLVKSMLDNSSKAPFLSTVADSSFITEALNSARNEITHLRSIGLPPRWVPHISSTKISEDPYRGTPRVTVNLYKPNQAIAHDRMLNIGDSVYDIVAATSYEIKQRLMSDATQHLLDDHLIPGRTYTGQELTDLITTNPAYVRRLSNPQSFGFGSRQAVMNDIIRREFNLTTFDPHSFGNVRSTKVRNGETLFMDRDLLSGLEDTINKGQLPQRGLVAKGTKIFRMAILGYSPRYLAHILLGGTFLMAIRAPLAIAFLPKAFKLLRDPEYMGKIAATSTQRGLTDLETKASAAFHEAAGRQMGKLHIQEYAAKGVAAANIVPSIMFKVTNWITDMQRAMVYGEAGWRAGLKKSVLDPMTGEKVAMTPERAQHEAMKAVDKVMGNLSHMSPLERNILTKLFPFWGWTKHILSYVATYPLDHPYKALILSHLANINSADVPNGLPLRIQNLFFLGNPDPYGNVSAVDVRAMNPLRDVANYASLGGWISGLNPAVTSLLDYIDPQMSFGGNVLYPNLTYDRLYGITEANAQGSLTNIAQQYIPQIGALDAALGLSNNLRDLKQSNPAAFTKAVFESLNIPFAQVQHLNLRQIAAKQEADRYAIAKNAALAYAKSPQPDPATLTGFTDLPSPQNPLYALSPAQLEELVAGAQQAVPGLPASESLPQLPSPNNPALL